MSYKSHYRVITYAFILFISPLFLLAGGAMQYISIDGNLILMFITKSPVIVSIICLIGVIAGTVVYVGALRVSWGLQKLDKLAELEDKADKKVSQAIDLGIKASEARKAYIDALQDLHGKIITNRPEDENNRRES